MPPSDNTKVSRIYADKYVSFNDEFSLTFSEFDPVGKVDDTPLSLDVAITMMDELLVKKFKTLQTIDAPVNIFLSGGIDTILLFSYLVDSNIPYNIVNGEHFELSHFLCANHNSIAKSYWAYSQLHNWHYKSIIISGACGDEFLMRGPATINMMMHFGENILQTPDSAYHYKYFLRESNTQLFASQLSDRKMQWLVQNKKLLVDKIIDMNLNDHQHWHLENTLTFTPYKDIEFTKILLRLPKEELIGQIYDASISKKLAELRLPGITKYLSKYKNYNQSEHMWEFYKKFAR